MVITPNSLLTCTWYFNCFWYKVNIQNVLDIREKIHLTSTVTLQSLKALCLCTCNSISYHSQLLNIRSITSAIISKFHSCTLFIPGGKKKCILESRLYLPTSSKGCRILVTRNKSLSTLCIGTYYIHGHQN